MREKTWGRNSFGRRIHQSGFAVLVFLVGTAMVETALADDWPNWRGPRRNGISKETSWQSTWPAGGPKIAWKAKVGLGYATFAVADGRVYTTGNEDNTDTVFCLDAVSGKELWTHSFPADRGAKSFQGGTTGTPTVSGDRVYTLSRWGDMFCFDTAKGTVIWKRNLRDTSDARAPTWGYSGSPVVHENLLILNVGDTGHAVDRASGETIWESGGKSAGYSTPLPVRCGDEWHVLLATAKSYLAVNLETGREVWRFRWLTQYGVNAADPIVSGDQVFISSGYGKGSALLRIEGSTAEEVWKSKVLRTQMNPAVLIDGYLYGLDGNAGPQAVLKCVEFATGKEMWAERGVGSGGLTAADGKLIVLSARGELMVAPASATAFKSAARAKVLEGDCWTVPILANSRIYCRNSAGSVVCVDVRKK